MAEWSRHRDRNATIRLLRQQGVSTAEVARRLRCSKSVVSYHASGVRVVQKVNGKVGGEATKLDWERKKAAIAALAKANWPKVKCDPALMEFIGLYWGEGNKASSAVGIVDSDPGVIKAAFEIFRKYCPKTEIKAVVRCYNDQNKQKCRAFWESILGITVKPTDKTWTGKLKKSKVRFGVCVLCLSNWEFKTTIMTWLNLRREELGVQALMDAFEE